MSTDRSALFLGATGMTNILYMCIFIYVHGIYYNVQVFVKKLQVRSARLF